MVVLRSPKLIGYLPHQIVRPDLQRVACTEHVAVRQQGGEGASFSPCRRCSVSFYTRPQMMVKKTGRKRMPRKIGGRARGAPMSMLLLSAR